MAITRIDLCAEDARLTHPPARTPPGFDGKFELVRVLAEGKAYWTVVDPVSAVHDCVDSYLRFVRLELDAAEITTKEYASNLAYYLKWLKDSGLDLDSATADPSSFSVFLHTLPQTQGKTWPRSPERLEQILTTVRGFYVHLVGQGSASLQALDRLHEQPMEMSERGTRSYAQSGEDLQIAYYVGRERISYIDLGCLWPKQYSNSFFFYERGGSGLCIDANPTIADEYTSARPRDLFVNCGIAATEGSMSYYMHNNPVFNTFSAEHAAELQRRVQAMEDSPQREGRSQTGVVEVPITTLDRAVDSSGMAERCDGRLDFLSIDVEGLELEVLSGFSFQALRPRLVVVEDVRRGARTRLSPEQLPAALALAAHRYWLAGWSGFNLYFMDEDL